MSAAHTQLWLATMQEAGCLFQRLCIAGKDDDEEQVRASVRDFAISSYECAIVKDLVKIGTLNDLAGNMLSLDLRSKHELDRVEIEYHPSQLNIEVAYDDYSPGDQNTPSRIETLIYPSQAAAEEAQRALENYSTWEPKYKELITVYTTDHSNFQSAQSPDDAVEVLENMLEEMYGEEEAEITV